jgi:hypothetical protein
MINKGCINFMRSNRRRDHGKVVCVLAGQVFDHKGYEVFEKLRCADFHNARSKIRMLVPEGIGFSRKDVEVVETPSGQLSEEEYANKFLTSDAVLMPYKVAKYRYSVSGVFVDAVTLGCLPFVSRHTTMAEELQKFGLDELAVDWDEFSWDFVVSITQNAIVKVKFDKMSLAYREQHCLSSFASAISRVLEL